jgi:AbiU2
MTAEKVREIAAAAFLDAIDVQFIIETLETGNTPLVAAAVQTVRTDKVVQCIYRSLWTRLLVVVARACAKARQGDLHVQYAFDLLKEPRVRSGVESTGNAAVLAEAIRLWAQCCGDHRLQSVLNFRNKQIAHRSELDAKIPLPIINDIFAISRARATVFERLAQGTGVISLSLDRQLMGYREQAERFWGK